MSAKSEKWKQENDFFINKRTGKLQYNAKCNKCANNCKQSYKVIIVVCPTYAEALPRSFLHKTHAGK